MEKKHSLKQWRSWVIKRNCYENVISYIKEQVPEIDKFFYPMIKKEYQTKRGSVTKDRPLYEGYLFLHYDNHDEVFHKLTANPFVTTYAGLVEDYEIKMMQDAQGKLLSDIKKSRFRKGDCVVLLEGPFKGHEAVVINTKSDNVIVKVNAQILGKPLQLIFQEDLLERKTQLKNMEIQNI